LLFVQTRPTLKVLLCSRKYFLTGLLTVGQLVSFKNALKIYNKDLRSALSDANNDVSQAATRITEGKYITSCLLPSLSPSYQTGRTQQWGSVSRKKDKKPVQNPSSKDATSARGESRAGRGGRGGRGGPGRGGAATRGRGGPPRVGRVNDRSRTASPRVVPATDSSPSIPVSSAASESADTPKLTADVNGDQNSVTGSGTDHKTAQHEVANTITPPVQHDAPPSAVPLVNLPPSHKQVPHAVKLSWAQIARYAYFCRSHSAPPILPLSIANRRPSRQSFHLLSNLRLLPYNRRPLLHLRLPRNLNLNLSLPGGKNPQQSSIHHGNPILHTLRPL